MGLVVENSYWPNHTVQAYINITPSSLTRPRCNLQAGLSADDLKTVCRIQYGDAHDDGMDAKKFLRARATYARGRRYIAARGRER